ncbi:hypothetical protein R1sor_004641 [Riccia sorocarpa]|uniref:Reverse transcriptase zinc-binding domain-containing protein n=1 Tax=Riccia sorocarpa TaxID=122646 RepID=A0ABD3HHA0_9MARC
MLREANTRGTLKPLKFGSEACANFCLFVDDMGVYLELEENSYLTLQGILAFFESASGARLNLHKSSALIIGKNVQSVALFAKHMGGFMENQTDAQWHKLPQAFIEGQRAKRCNNSIRGDFQPQETLLLNRKIYQGKSYMAKALIATWDHTTKDLHWSPTGVNIHSHLTLRDLSVLTMKKDGKKNDDIKLIMNELRKKGVTTVGQLWEKRHKLLEMDRDQLNPLTIELVRRVNTSTGPERGLLHSTNGWSWKPQTPVKSFQRSAQELYRITQPDQDWTADSNKKWRLSDNARTWKRRWRLIWNSNIPPKDTTFLWRITRQGLYTAERAEKFGFGVGECPVCHRGRETVNHLFLHCQSLQPYWRSMQKDDLIPPGCNITSFQLSFPKFIDVALRKDPASIARWKVLIELWKQVWLIRNLLAYEGRKKETTVWLCVRQALDKTILKWREREVTTKFFVSSKNSLTKCLKGNTLPYTSG